MNRFTFAELADMHLCYGAANSNALAARRLYAQRFPQRVLPSHVLFANVDRRIRETGTVHVSKQSILGKHFVAGKFQASH